MACISSLDSCRGTSSSRLSTGTQRALRRSVVVVSAFAVIAFSYPATVEEVDCPSLLDENREASMMSQWQQDWFVYHNFIKGTDLDIGSSERDARPGVFVDVGAFHPFQLSNTFFFEHCLGWSGVCVEPNPRLAPYFDAFRPKCNHVRNCVWAHERNVTMSYEKDPIEAYIQEDDGEAGQGSGSLIGGNGALLKSDQGASSADFKATCRPLDTILSSAGLRRPATIDYMSVDAEAAEVEIFRAFPFHEFDISVISVEVQVVNYYELDIIFFAAGYVKVAVLGGDHVYAKLKTQLASPQSLSSWHERLKNDFYQHAEPRTATVADKKR